MAIIAAAAARRSGAGGTDADAQDYFDRVAANSGTLSGTTQGAVNTFVVSAKSHGYWSKLRRINLLCGDYAAMFTPLVGAAVDTNGANLVSGDYSEATGLTGNGSTKWLDTGYQPIADGQSESSFGMFVYLGAADSRGVSAIYLGSGNSSLVNTTALGVRLSGTVLAGAIGGNVTQIAPASASPSVDGFIGVVANGSRSNQFYRDGSAFGAPVAMTSSFYSDDISVGLLGYKTDGATQYYTNATVCAYAITTGLSADEVADFSSDLNAFQTALGRNVY